MKKRKLKLAAVTLIAALIPHLAANATSLFEARMQHLRECQASLAKSNAQARKDAAASVSGLLAHGKARSFWVGDWAEVVAISDRIPADSRLQKSLRFSIEFDAVAAMERNPGFKPYVANVIQALSGLIPAQEECSTWVPVIVDIQRDAKGRGWTFMVEPRERPGRRGIVKALFGAGTTRAGSLVPLTEKKYSNDPSAPPIEEVRFYTDKEVNDFFNWGATVARTEFGPSIGYWNLAMYKIIAPKLDENCRQGAAWVFELVSTEGGSLSQKLKMADDMFEVNCGRRPMATDRDAPY